MIDRDLVVRYTESFLGKWYTWGGDDPVGGVDCSGLTGEVLQAFGRQARNVRLNAAGIRQWLLGTHAQVVSAPRHGDIVFWLNAEGVAKHVEIIWWDTRISIGASGGGPETKTLEDAIRMNAFVKPRPWRSRGGKVEILDPWETWNAAA